MQTLKLKQFLSGVEARKRSLGITDTEELTEALRNRGSGRSERKRGMLRRADDRARAAGVDPIQSYY